MNATVTKILDLVIKYLPSLIVIAEGLFSWKKKAGVEKKEFVQETLHTVVNGIEAESTGGQKETWEKIGDPVGKLIDASVEIANETGVFNNMGMGG